MIHSSHKNTRGFRPITLLLGVSVLLIAFAPVSAQEMSGESLSGDTPAVSDTELEQFVSALGSIQAIQQQMVAATESTVADSELQQERFEELLQANQGGTQLESAPTTAEQREYNRLVTEIRTIQRDSNQQMIAAVREVDLDVQRFNEIAQAAQGNPDLMARLESVRQGGES